MATVYLAVARAGVKNVRKLVVLKLLNENLTANDDAVAMFLREARLAAELSHPNVVSTYTVGQDEGRYYILMEYLEGVSLRRLMTHAAEWSLTDRFPLLGALCLALSGLKYVHEFHDYQGNNLNLVHRDVKPDNIFLTTTGQVKLLDFGVAKIRAADYGGTLGGEVIKGTVQYLAPEAVRSAGDVDQRSDIFSAGVVLTELATGARFWGDEAYPAILTRLSKDELPPIRSADGEELPPALRRICESAIHTDREKRIQTAFELRKAIQGFLVKQGYLLDTSDLAALVQEVYAPIAAERAEAIRDATQAPSESSGDMEAMMSSDGNVTSVDFTQQSSSSVVGAPPTGNQTEVTAMPLEGQGSNKKLIAIPIVLALAAPLAYFAFRGGDEDKPAGTAQVQAGAGDKTAVITPPKVEPAEPAATPSEPASATPTPVPAADNPATPATPVVTPPPPDSADADAVGEEDELEVEGDGDDDRAERRRTTRRPARRRSTPKPDEPEPAEAVPPAPETPTAAKPVPAKPTETRVKIEPNPYTR